MFASSAAKISVSKRILVPIRTQWKDFIVTRVYVLLISYRYVILFYIPRQIPSQKRQKETDIAKTPARQRQARKPYLDKTPITGNQGNFINQQDKACPQMHNFNHWPTFECLTSHCAFPVGAGAETDVSVSYLT